MAYEEDPFDPAGCVDEDRVRRMGTTRRIFMGTVGKAGIAAVAATGRFVGFAPSVAAADPPECTSNTTYFSCTRCYYGCAGQCSDTQSCCDHGSGSNDFKCCICAGKGGCGYRAKVWVRCSTDCYWCCIAC